MKEWIKKEVLFMWHGRKVGNNIEQEEREGGIKKNCDLSLNKSGIFIKQ